MSRRTHLELGHSGQPEAGVGLNLGGWDEDGVMSTVNLQIFFTFYIRFVAFCLVNQKIFLSSAKNI